MKKVLFTVFLVLYYICYSFAQVKEGKYEKLYELFSKRRYEDCLYKAENLTLKDKTKKEPEPYLYMSMCLYELSKLPDPEGYYKTAFRYSLKQAAKCRKKDKKNYYYNNNLDYFNELKGYAINKAKTQYEEEKYRKAASVYKQILKFDYDDDNVRLMKGVCDLLAHNLYEGNVNINIAINNINANYKKDPVSEHLLTEGLIIYSDYLYHQSEVDTANTMMLIDSAKVIISFGMNLFPVNNDIISQYEKLNKF